jgi:hypothetical protein
MRGCYVIQTLFISDKTKPPAGGFGDVSGTGERLQVGFEKLLERSKGNFARGVVIEIDMVCARDNHQRFLFAADRLKASSAK